MKRVTEYFGEDWDANDPSRVLRIVRDFMNLFDKSMAEIEVRARPQSLSPCIQWALKALQFHNYAYDILVSVGTYW
jgi:hypothetical protein